MGLAQFYSILYFINKRQRWTKPQFSRSDSFKQSKNIQKLKSFLKISLISTLSISQKINIGLRKQR